ncbi:MAG: hypothetical protein HY958_11820 [Bacteroidia bacterium]|nr:hypothetical protein [Bacteroidia bacterium]
MKGQNTSTLRQALCDATLSTRLENIITLMQELNMVIDKFKIHLFQNETPVKIPQIEIDLALVKVRRLYDELLQINSLNAQITEHTGIHTSPEKQTDLHLPFEENVSKKTEENKQTILDAISKKEQPQDFATRLQQKPISDINEAIGLGEKLLFINELFGKNPDKYSESVVHLNNCVSLEDAMEYINKNFIWDPEKETAIAFMDLVRRKFI